MDIMNWYQSTSAKWWKRSAWFASNKWTKCWI